MKAKKQGKAQSITSDLKATKQAKDVRVSGGKTKWALGIAIVVSVDYTEFTVSLRVVQGEDQSFVRSHVPLTTPGGGSRATMLYMPEPGDRCIIGHLAQESSGHTTQPVILGWVPPASWLGHDWLMSAPFSQEEVSFTPKNKTRLGAVHQRVRHKLRHVRPGNIVFSSSQGSDIALDEGVLITNRRCNEIRLRDQDQSIVMRSLQQFHATAGVRVYTGQVQRDAASLPTQMFSDGIDWAGRRQINPETGEPYTDSEMRSWRQTPPAAFLTPDPVFSRIDPRTGEPKDVSLSGLYLEPNIDPYLFLQRGLFIGPLGFSYDDKVENDAVYGGKPYYRPAVLTGPSGKPLNAAVDEARSFTEHRVEVAHSSDGRIPVTEQTDNFDADRLPRAPQTGFDPQGVSGNAPYIEVVHGTAVGNDPYTAPGRAQYGLPLRARLFTTGGTLDPGFEPAPVRELETHVASLYRMTPPTPLESETTWWAVTKDGRVKASIGGTLEQPFSFEAAFASGVRLSTPERFVIEAKSLDLRLGGDDTTSEGINLASQTGAVRIYGGGQSQANNLSRRTAPTGGGTRDAPSLHLEGKDTVLVKSSKNYQLETGETQVKTGGYRLNAQSGVSIQGGDQLGLSAKTVDLVSTGRATMTFSGPKDALPSSGPLRTTTVSGLAVGPADLYRLTLGDRVEQITLGNDSTIITAGNMTHLTNAGVFTAGATPNTLSIDSGSGINMLANAGQVLVSAATSVTVSGQASVTIRSSGPTVLSGQAGVTLGAAGGKVGPIVSGADLDPLTGQPLSFYGMGSPTHLLGPAV